MDKDNMNKDNMNKDNMDGKEKGKDIDDKPQTFIDMKNHYEIEYLHFMINILEPFIEFKSGQSNDVTIILPKLFKLLFIVLFFNILEAILIIEFLTFIAKFILSVIRID